MVQLAPSATYLILKRRSTDQIKKQHNELFDSSIKTGRSRNEMSSLPALLYPAIPASVIYLGSIIEWSSWQPELVGTGNWETLK